MGKILILLQTCYKLISRLFRSHRTRKCGLKIFPTNLTPSNHEIKILKTSNFACFFRKTISKITFWPNIFCELVLRSRLSRIVPTTALEIALRHFQECKSTTGGGEAGNPPGKMPNIWPDLRFGSADSQIWPNVRFSPGRIHCLPTPGGGLTLLKMPQGNP